MPLSISMLCQIPFSCYARFRYAWFRYAWFQFTVMPDSRFKFPCYTCFRYATFRYTTFHFYVITDSVIPGSVISDSYFPCYTWFRNTTFRYTQIRYTRFPIPLFSSRGNNRPILIVEWRRVLSAEAQKKGSCTLEWQKIFVMNFPHLTLKGLIFPPRSHQKNKKIIIKSLTQLDVKCESPSIFHLSLRFLALSPPILSLNDSRRGQEFHEEIFAP